MALTEALHNIAENFEFHFSIRGALLRRYIYLTVYYFIFIVFRWGDRHLRCLIWLKRLGLSDLKIDVVTPDKVRLRLDLHTAFDPLFSILHDRDYDRLDGFGLSAGMSIIDVGANIGIYTTLCAKRVGGHGKVLAIEPHPDNFRLLTQNVERNNFKNVYLVQAAADEKEGTAELFLHERCINHSLVRQTGSSIPVRVRTLDDIAREFHFDHVDIIKIDTEGNVPAILRGARQLIKNHKPRIVFERDPESESRGLYELFKEFNYETRELRCFTYAWPIK